MLYSKVAHLRCACICISRKLADASEMFNTPLPQPRRSLFNQTWYKASL